MHLHNIDIAEQLGKIADLLAIKGDNQFRIRSYRTASRTIAEYSGSITAMVQQEEDLTRLPGIGKDLAGKIAEIVTTGTLSLLKELEKEIPVTLLELLDIETLGAKKVGALHRQLGVTSLDELEQAAKRNEIQELDGFGKKTEEKILEEITRLRQSGGEQRFRWAVAEELITPFRTHLQELQEIESLTVAGSYRRKKETVGDIDMLATCRDPDPVMDHFVRYENVSSVISKGKTKSSVKLQSGLQVDLRVVPHESYGAALHYFTGSKDHNVVIRKRGVARGLKINEYGVFKDDELIAGRTEEEIFQSVGLGSIVPELRENRGEIEACEQNRLPSLVEQKDIRGDLQTHSTYSDGVLTIEEMVNAAIELGYEYIAITDHSKRVSVANGMDEKRLAEQIETIDTIQEKYPNVTIIKSVEVDILEDGSLDLSDDILKELDMVLCSIHYNRNLSLEKQTERVLKAMDNRYFNILAHPTGRLIGSREPYEIDLYRIMKAAKDRGCFLEINAHPERLDLNDSDAKMAKEMGLTIPISTDAHSKDNLRNMRFGIMQARRGWLEKDDVLNTRPWKELSKLLKR